MFTETLLPEILSTLIPIRIYGILWSIVLCFMGFNLYTTVYFFIVLRDDKNGEGTFSINIFQFSIVEIIGFLYIMGIKAETSRIMPLQLQYIGNCAIMYFQYVGSFILSHLNMTQGFLLICGLSNPIYSCSGTFALYSLLCRHVKISIFINFQVVDEEISTYNFDDFPQAKTGSRVKSMLEIRRMFCTGWVKDEKYA